MPQPDRVQTAIHEDLHQRFKVLMAHRTIRNEPQVALQAVLDQILEKWLTKEETKENVPVSAT